MSARWGLLVLALAACRTEIKPLVVAERAEPKPAAVEAATGECIVHDYRMATEVPAGATNLGWVTVPRGSDELSTLAALKKAICAKGGSALSQAHWNRAPGASVGDAPIELEANAWAEPAGTPP